jgi:uncharacterized protein (DUF1697 family)
VRWVLLLRAVNLGPRNKLAMADLRRVLEGLGHEEVKTYLNSGNATFTSSSRSAKALAEGVEKALEKELGLSVGAVVRSPKQVQVMVDDVPADVDGYVVVCVLFDVPDRKAVKELAQWEPERVVPGDGVLYLGYERVQGSKLTPALIEKRLGVRTTARTPATLRKLV